ncbi:hypothetical protein [Streptomyces lannensis]|uniref:Uncharacterized protein n=1 Tax=Streptomyces lannensis TaxID=766498 RepID=A0ABP7KRU3_9ACTN
MGSITLATPSTSPTSLVAILTFVLGSSVVAAALGHILTGLRASTTIRRDRYASAVKLLVARIEYPYRIRRRTSDDPEVLHTLATTGHDLQERLAEISAWISTESTALSDVFEHCLTRLDTPFKQACNDAWNAAPITTAAGMNLGGLPMGNQQHVAITMERALAYRFGPRRAIPAFLLRRILNKRGLLP